MPIRYDKIPPPDWRATLAELRLPLDLLLSAPWWLRLLTARSANPRTVLLIPGFGASGRSMSLLGAYLRYRGHQVFDWEQGRNTGNVPELLVAVRRRVISLVDAVNEAVVLVGWSLGGYLAREVARDEPERVRKVITLGSPVIGGPRFTAVARWYRTRGFDLDKIERKVAQRFAIPLRVPVAAIYSERDGVVAWQACIDRWSPHARHIEVSETHIGLGFSPRVLAIVADEVDKA